VSRPDAPRATAPTFVIARNPDPDSSLPFLIRLPLPDGVLVLKTADTWPRTAKVYCHRAEGWPADPDVVEAVPLRACQRRGVAIDLVLERAHHNRSQLVFTTVHGGREAIFWQSPRTTRKARPGIRVPTRRASGLAELVIRVDTRERYPYRFTHQQARTERRALPAGDYGVELDGEIVAVVERKTVADLAARLVDGQLAYALAELATVDRAALVVEDRYADVFKLDHVTPGFVADLLATVQVRYPTVPIVFCDTRPLAEEWTFRFLGAARAYAQAHGDSS
jgi:ERCC4 domain